MRAARRWRAPPPPTGCRDGPAPFRAAAVARARPPPGPGGRRAGGRVRRRGARRARADAAADGGGRRRGDDLPAGAQVDADDVRAVELPLAAAPDRALRTVEEVAGRVLAGPVRAGEPLTDVRLLGAGLVPPGGQVAVPVRVAEPALPLLVAAGDRVDVLATSLEGADAARAVVTAVPVLAVPAAEDTADGALLVVAASPAAAARLAAAAVTSRLSVAVHGR
ncbi:MAG TPA: SAF domain-containing protein [Mycobacteriales bacterium]|nr:SAF domain-containing protein [Mycobacteriales bacterium]